jgi:hypothetical protein
MSSDLLQDQIRLIGREANLIFDVGAHTGQSTLEYLTNFPHARIFSFEPDATNAAAALAAAAIIANGVAFTTWLYRTQMAPLSFISIRMTELIPCLPLANKNIGRDRRMRYGKSPYKRRLWIVSSLIIICRKSTS